MTQQHVRFFKTVSTYKYFGIWKYSNIFFVIYYLLSLIGTDSGDGGATLPTNRVHLVL